MKVRNIICTILGIITGVLHAEREEYDFNFDGHMDYRVLSKEDGRADRYDVFLYDPKSKSFIKELTLSGTICPLPDTASKEVRCIWSGGHSGAIYTGTVYRWIGKKFELAYSVRQEAVKVDGEFRYIRVRAKVVDGKPRITSVERVKPHWED